MPKWKILPAMLCTPTKVVSKPTYNLMKLLRFTYLVYRAFISDRIDVIAGKVVSKAQVVSPRKHLLNILAINLMMVNSKSKLLKNIVVKEMLREKVRRKFSTVI